MLNKKVFCLLLIFCGPLNACQKNLPAVSELPPVQVADNINQSKQQFTAKQLLFRVTEKARQWDYSARLVRAEAKFVDEKGRADWVYYFISVFKNKALQVDLAGNTKEVDTHFWGREMDLRDWKIDSNRAVEIAMEKGLTRFPADEIHLEHRFIDPEWEIRNWQGSFRVNAKTGVFGRIK